MDELFDRIKAIKIKRKYLVISLIASELLGILTLIWFLRAPLSQKFLTPTPKAYSVVSLNPQKRYVISQGDFLRGQASPNTSVKILITPGDIKDSILSDSKGDWKYQIPLDLSIGSYTFSIGNFDESNKLINLQSYRLRVRTNTSLSNLLNFWGTPQEPAETALDLEE